MNGSLATVGELFGLLQQDTGERMINLIGPMNVRRGDSLDLRLTITDDEDAREDITGATIELTILTDAVYLAGTGAATVAKSVGSGITILDQTEGEDTVGQADIVITSADLNIASGRYWIGVVVVLDGKRKHVIAPREFTIDPFIEGP